MNPIGAAIFIAILIPAYSQGQEKSPSPQPPAQVEKVIFPHSEVLLILEDLDKVKGIVLNNNFHEKITEKGWEDAVKGEKGSGCRLWYVNSTNSYVFFPWNKIRKHEVLRSLTEVDVRKIRRAVEEKSRKNRNQPPAKEDSKEEKQDQGSKDPDGGSKGSDGEKTKKLTEEEKLSKLLFEKFPPERGWGPDRLDKIRINKINDIYPTREEAEFEQGYDLWMKAYKVYREELEKRLEEEKKKAEAKKQAKDKSDEEKKKDES